MLIYEVNLEVEDDAAAAYAGWLADHIQKMLTFKGFTSAQWFFRLPEEEGREATSKKLWTVQYMVESTESLEEYFQQHAEATRKEAEDRFGGKFKAERRVLHLLSVAVNQEALAKQMREAGISESQTGAPKP
jgi:hypothetical protein